MTTDHGANVAYIIANGLDVDLPEETRIARVSRAVDMYVEKMKHLPDNGLTDDEIAEVRELLTGFRPKPS